MAKEKFIEQRFHAASRIVIAEANKIIGEYQAQGYTMTLRQLYYQFIARDTFPASWIDKAYNQRNGLDENTKNTEKNYKKLGELLSNARRAGLVDWDAIEDRTRYVRQQSMWLDPTHILHGTAEQYLENPWRTQPYYVELWVEKDALLGVVGRIADRWRLPYLACKGYGSQSELYAAGKRFAQARRHGKLGMILHLGDHDPSGMDMSRDNLERVNLYARRPITFRRLALTMDQVEKYDPPPNPAKETDSRYNQYQAEFGDTCWEVDALPPDVLSKIVGDVVEEVIDWEAWEKAMRIEATHRAQLRALPDNWLPMLHQLLEREQVPDPEPPYDPRDHGDDDDFSSDDEDDEEDYEPGEGYADDPEE